MSAPEHAEHSDSASAEQIVRVIENAIFGYSDPFRWEGDEAFPEGVSRFIVAALRERGMLAASPTAPDAMIAKLGDKVLVTYAAHREDAWAVNVWGRPAIRRPSLTEALVAALRAQGEEI